MGQLCGIVRDVQIECVVVLGSQSQIHHQSRWALLHQSLDHYHLAHHQTITSQSQNGFALTKTWMLFEYPQYQRALPCHDQGEWQSNVTLTCA